jgi:DNA excision repair protein ERCC-5
MQVYNAYMQPIVDEDPETLDWGMPDLDGIRRYMRQKAGWDEVKTDGPLLPAVFGIDLD